MHKGFKCLIGLEVKTFQMFYTRLKKIKVCGVEFTIKKVNMLDYLEGSKVLLQAYDTHKTAGTKLSPQVIASDEKIKRHYKDILVAGIVKPKVTFKKEDGAFHVDDFFVNWLLVDGLYTEIMFLTYGKKKLKQAISAVKG